MHDGYQTCLNTYGEGWLVGLFCEVQDLATIKVHETISRLNLSPNSQASSFSLQQSQSYKKAQHSSPCLVPAPRHHQGSAATNMVTALHPSICCFLTAQQKQFMKVMPHTGRYAERHCENCFYFFQRSIRRQREGVGILFPISICSCCCSACKITLLNLWHPAWLLWK